MKRLIISCILICAIVFPLLAVEYPEGSPRFSSTSGDKVLFRYKFTAGQKVTIEMSMDMYIKTVSEMGEMEMPFTMTFEAYYTVNKVTGEGNARAVLIISRMTMKAEGLLDIYYDSADPETASNPQFQQANLMINVPIPIEISPLGELVDFDTNPLIEAAKKLGTQMDPESIEQQLQELTKSSFVQLSPNPLKAGDIYDAGTISSSFGQMSSMEAIVKYQVIAISGDKKQAILKPVVTFSFPGVTLKRSDFQGWILFDLEKGNIVESYGKQLLEIETVEGGKTSSVLMDMIVVYKSHF
ncbi:MAG: hypothetical protein JW822_05085 [Spirochaetales bacterium]|nr:hypothetical protein [Spirochaetales bacterium]